jgi:hypothetical protein
MRLYRRIVARFWVRLAWKGFNRQDANDAKKMTEKKGKPSLLSMGSFRTAMPCGGRGEWDAG